MNRRNYQKELEQILQAQKENGTNRWEMGVFSSPAP